MLGSVDRPSSPDVEVAGSVLLVAGSLLPDVEGPVPPDVDGSVLAADDEVDGAGR